MHFWSFYETSNQHYAFYSVYCSGLANQVETSQEKLQTTLATAEGSGKMAAEGSGETAAKGLGGTAAASVVETTKVAETANEDPGNDGGAEENNGESSDQLTSSDAVTEGSGGSPEGNSWQFASCSRENNSYLEEPTTLVQVAFIS